MPRTIFRRGHVLAALPLLHAVVQYSDTAVSAALNTLVALVARIGTHATDVSIGLRQLNVLAQKRRNIVHHRFNVRPVSVTANSL